MLPLRCYPLCWCTLNAREPLVLCCVLVLVLYCFVPRLDFAFFFERERPRELARVEYLGYTRCFVDARVSGPVSLLVVSVVSEALVLSEVGEGGVLLSNALVI